MAKHPGDDGDWNLDSGNALPMSIRERLNTLIDLPSREQAECMRAEDAFLRGVAETMSGKRFTNRPPGRNG